MQIIESQAIWPRAKRNILDVCVLKKWHFYNVVYVIKQKCNRTSNYVIKLLLKPTNILQQ